LRLTTTIENTGNVRITPDIAVTVLSKATVVESFTSGSEFVYPNETKAIVTEWNSGKAAPEHIPPALPSTRGALLSVAETWTSRSWSAAR